MYCLMAINNLKHGTHWFLAYWQWKTCQKYKQAYIRNVLLCNNISMFCIGKKNDMKRKYFLPKEMAKVTKKMKKKHRERDREREGYQ